MTTPKLFRSSTFRFSLAYMGIFSVSVLLLLSFIYWSTAGFMLRQTEETIGAELSGLVERYQRTGLPGLRDMLNERLQLHARANDADLYLLTDAQFKPLLGNLPRWPQAQPSDQGWLSLQLGAGKRQHHGLARAFLLPEGYHLLVGRDIHDLEETQTLIREALFWGLLLTFVLALIGGVMMSRTMLHRIEIINTTCRQIMAGDLSRRIPSRGGDDDFDQLVDNLNRMLQQIEELMQGVRQVTNNIAHDLRTPLSRLRRRLDMLRENRAADERQQELLEQTIAEADGLLATFKALLRISEIESGSRRGGFQQVDLSALIRDLSELYQPLSEDNRQQFRAEVAATRPISGDRNLLFQAFANLLENAIKYTPAGGQIELRLTDHPDRLEVVVGDTGPGIPAAARQKVFERFYRLEESRSTPGNGLGLSLVAAIVTLHQGEIELADNQPGLKVTIRLPRLA